VAFESALGVGSKFRVFLPEATTEPLPWRRPPEGLASRSAKE
jgi:hypothetical protein